jgi:hypothetical protein
MNWVLKRVSLIVALAVTLAALIATSVHGNPNMPLIDGWLDPDDERLAAEALLLILIFLLTLLLTSIVQRYVERGSPNSFKGWMFELDWTPEGAAEMRDIYQRLQADQQETAQLLQATVTRIQALEKK